MTIYCMPIYKCVSGILNTTMYAILHLHIQCIHHVFSQTTMYILLLHPSSFNVISSHFPLIVIGTCSDTAPLCV